MRNLKGKKIIFFLLPGVITAGILILLFFVYGYAPFGNRTLAVMDAHIQYLDFFMYLKNVLSGDDRIAYTFGQTLGGCNVAVFSYYLASPFNLFVVFFDKENLHVFFHLLIVCKLALSAITFHIFISERYDRQLSEAAAGMMSVSYALSQYNIAQCSNIMWLDGVYLLPLLLLGVYRIVNGKSSRMLMLSTGASMLFNWYTGALNCLFTAVWFLIESGIELFINKRQIETMPKKYGYIGRIILKYFLAMAVGIMLSMILFLPTLAALQGGKGGIEWEAFTFGITGEFPSMIQSYVIGSTSFYGSVSLFCGSIPVVACIGCFFTNHISKKEKAAVALIITGVVLMFYWKPCFFIFSLFRKAESYFYRYSYLGIITMLFITAFFFSKCNGKERIQAVWKASAVFAVLLIALHYVHPLKDLKNTYITAGSVLVFALLIALHTCRGAKSNMITFMLVTAVLTELAGNTALLMKAYHAENVTDYSIYVKNEQQRINEILNMDHGIYRISQTMTRSEENDHLTANYNEALAYGYQSISGYTSDPDNKQIEFLGRMGYAVNACMNIVNTSVLAADSLLGVKYLLAPFMIKGMERLEEFGKSNGKYVYKNSFCLPFAFRYKKSDLIRNDNVNPFEYQNDLYKQLTGETIRLYRPISYHTELVTEREVYYKLSIPKGNYAVYGNLPWEQDMEGVLNVNGVYETGYAKWLSPSVFYIPVSEENLAAEVRLTAASQLRVADVQFYVLDLDLMAQITKELTDAAAEEIQVENGYAKFRVDHAEPLEHLYLSIPYDNGWKIKVNGKSVQAEQFEGCMLSIPLQDGNNLIEMEYRIPYLKIGILFTIVGIVLFILFGNTFITKKSLW